MTPLSDRLPHQTASDSVLAAYCVKFPSLTVAWLKAEAVKNPSDMSFTCRLVRWGLEPDPSTLLVRLPFDFHRFHRDPSALLWFFRYLLEANIPIQEVMRLAASSYNYREACDHIFTAREVCPIVIDMVKGPYLRALFMRKHRATAAIGHHQAALFDRCEAADIEDPLSVIPKHERLKVEQQIAEARSRPAPAEYLGQGGLLRRDARALAGRIKDPELRAQFNALVSKLDADGRITKPKGATPPPPLTAEAARAEVSYNPKAGDIIDNATGKPAQAYVRNGVPWFKACGHIVAVHKLAFLLVTGRMPNGRVIRLRKDTFPAQDNSAKNLQWGLPEDQAAWTGVPVTGPNAVLRQSGITWNKGSKRWMVRVMQEATDGTRERKCIASTREYEDAVAAQRDYLAAQQS